MNRKWQFVPVVRDAKGTPDPRLILVHGQMVSSKGGTFYLDYIDPATKYCYQGFRKSGIAAR